jgi:hypothetical protein
MDLPVRVTRQFTLADISAWLTSSATTLSGFSALISANDCWPSDSDGRRLTAADDLFERILPGESRPQLPFIEPDRKSPLLERRAQCFHGGFVVAVVAEENVKLH